MYTNEIWKDIKGYEGKYKVSNKGRIKSLNYQNSKKEKLLHLRIGKKRRGYLDVMLSSKNVQKRYKIHRLVAEAFIPNPNNYPEINHIDEDVSNNNVNNLEWCTKLYNLNYGNHRENIAKKKRIPILKCDLNGSVLEEYEGIHVAARSTGNAASNISAAILGKQKTCGGYIWKKK